MPKQVIMPALGMAQESGLLLAWLKNEGDTVQKGDPIMEIETDKITVEIEANASGKLVNFLAKAGDDIPVGDVIAYILYQGETLADISQSTTTIAEPQSAVKVIESESMPSVSPVAARMLKELNLAENDIPSSNGRIKKADIEAYLKTQIVPTKTRLIPASPKARRIAGEKNYDLSEINGTGPDGAIITKDVLSYTPIIELPPTLEPAMAVSEEIETSRLWKVMATRLTTSWQTIPHFYLKRSVNVDALIDWRSSLGNINISVTYTDLLVQMVARALVEHPRLNARFVEGAINRNIDINIGLAVAVDDGLLVPVIHQADRLGVKAISEARARLVQGAQSASLQPSDLQNGTFTISNLGMFGVDEFNAIVNPPQVAILAIGAIQARLEMVDNQVTETNVMTLCLSCDHRAVDGARGAQFLQTLANFISDPRLMMS